MSTYTDRLKQLTRQYNDAIMALKDSYRIEESQLGWLSSPDGLRRQYSQKYDMLANEYRQRAKQEYHAFTTAHPAWARKRQIWGWIFVIGIILMAGSCAYQMPMEEESPSEQTLGNGETTYWNAENIPIPHLQDASQYVSNPDQVLTQSTLNRMNSTLQRMDSELGIESVVIVVNHIENDDPFRFAQEVGNKYGVGRQDRGLMIVVGYQDRAINISPGRSLEGDLTDVECHRLEQTYVVPAMRANQPDSAMIYLTEAVYALMQKKALPQMSELTSESDAADDEIARLIGIYMLIAVAWGALYLYLNDKYQWVAILGTSLMANPFVTHQRIYIGGFGGGGGGGGGFSGGSFGGGSFGGGGATSRW